MTILKYEYNVQDSNLKLKSSKLQKTRINNINIHSNSQLQ